MNMDNKPLNSSLNLFIESWWQRELFKYGTKTDDECCFRGENDSIDHFYSLLLYEIIHTKSHSMVKNNVQFTDLSNYGGAFIRTYFQLKWENKSYHTAQSCDEIHDQ